MNGIYYSMNVYFNAGDLDFFWKEQIASFSWFPQVYQWDKDFGVSSLFSLWLTYPFTIVTKLFSSVGLSWWMIEKMLWLSVFILGIVSSYALAKYVLSNSRISFLSSLLYIGNTYFLLLFGGGQLGMALAYSFAPLVLYTFIKTIDQGVELRSTKYEVSRGIRNGLVFALLVCFDLRLACILFGVIALYIGLRIFDKNIKMYEFRNLIIHNFIIPIITALALHMYWILPIIMGKEGLSMAGEEFTEAGMLRFLSVADFSHALALTHPNWPENLFGKVYFMQPEFLLLPLLAFGALLFLIKDLRSLTLRSGQAMFKDQMIVFFAFLALVGVFLSKGAQDPFGGLYVWLFVHIPGFVLFRDPTKFYLLTALSYSILIPFTLLQTSQWITDTGLMMKDKIKKRHSLIINFLPVSMQVLSLIFILFLVFTMRPLWMGKLSGNFRPIQRTDEFIQLKDLIIEDISPSRTLWLPKPDKFLYASTLHPVLSGETLYKNASISSIISSIQEPLFKETIRNAGVKYVIIPVDIEKRIFLSNYVFDSKEREILIKTLLDTGLYRLPQFKELAVFENPTFLFHREVPDFIKKQEYWLRIGFIISVISLIGSILVLILRDTQKKK